MAEAPPGREKLISYEGQLSERYLVLLKRCLTRYLFDEPFTLVDVPRGSLKGAMWQPIRAFLRRKGYTLVRPLPFDPEARAEGRDRPAAAETMVGLRRLDNVQHCIRDVLSRGVPGDLIECGVWRGGVAIFMRACLLAYGDSTRTVWVADSFRGLPKPKPELYPADAGLDLWRWPQLAVSAQEVRANFSRYDLLDERVCFLEGWFSETLPSAPIERLALLRIDADLYESTMDALSCLYRKVSPGGYVIVDDYGAIPACRQAVEDFRERFDISEPLHQVDWTAVYWQKARETE